MSTSGPLSPINVISDSGGLGTSDLISSSSAEKITSHPSSTSHSLLSSIPPLAPQEAEDSEEVTDTFKINIQNSDLKTPFSNAGYNHSGKQKAEGEIKCTSPRSPPSGKEKTHNVSEWNCHYPSLSWEKTASRPSLQQIFQDEGGGDGPALVESDDEVSPNYGARSPPHWPRSLCQLLDDAAGAEIFKAFVLERTGSIKMIDFWYACNGLRNQTNPEDMKELIYLIWKSFIRNLSVKVTSETYKSINDSISRKEFQTHIFDKSQLEVEEKMNETLYPCFLESNVYLSWLLSQKPDEPISPSSPAYTGVHGSYLGLNLLPTVHENAEFVGPHHQDKVPRRLTSNSLRYTANYRAVGDGTKSGTSEGYYLKPSGMGSSPYHHCFPSGHAISLQDSEIQSLSSGAHTDETLSCTSSSLSVTNRQTFNPRYVKRHFHKICEDAKLNPIESAKTSEVVMHTYIIPRTMRIHSKNNATSGVDAETLKELLNKVKDKQESDEKVKESFWELTHNEQVPDEVRREHAVNSLPPNLLVDKLVEKVPIGDLDPSQSILDEHIARWDSPGSPKPASKSPPTKTGKVLSKQFPHLNLSSSTSTIAKNSSKAVRHQAALARPSMGYPSHQKDGLLSMMHGHSGQFPHGGRAGPNQIVYPSQSRNSHHMRRRERGQDVYSTFSSDSGNVADYHDACEQKNPANLQLPKSKSMPEYMEHQTGTTSDGGCSGSRRQCSGTRRSTRRPPAELTDSGVSVVSDTGPSAGPSSLTSDRVNTWLVHCGHFDNSGTCSTAHSVFPCERVDFREHSKARGTRSVHTLAGSTSPGTQRRSGSSGRRSQCSSSISGNTCISLQPSCVDTLSSLQFAPAQASMYPPPGSTYQLVDLSRDSPIGQAQQLIYSGTDKRKNRCGNVNKSCSASSIHGDGSSSNGSTLKKQQKTAKHGEFVGQSIASVGMCRLPVQHTTTAACASQPAGAPHPPQLTAIVYNFHDDEVPFITKVPTQTVTLKKFKQHLPKKGNYRFYFKKKCEDIEDIGVVYEEISDDSDILPLFEGKIFSQIRKDE